MSLISPTTLFVAGSISITLSPAAFVWTMRTVAACSDAAAAASAATRTKDLVFIAAYFMLRSHVDDRLFRRPAAGRIRAGLRGLQGEDPAPAARETAGPRPLHRVPRAEQRVSAAGAVGRRQDLERGTV